MNRKITLFKIDNTVILEETKDLMIDAVERMKGWIAQAHGILAEDVEVEIVETEIELSGIDVTSGGMFSWLDADYILYKGVKCTLILGSDEHLDAINNGTVENYLKFN
jgi:type I site-specific restriction endonuclease